jgi:5,10-methylenetetrahydromethanopterin reductase
MTGKLAIAISGGPRPSEIVEILVKAEKLGYESGWVAEGHGGDQFAIIASAASKTEHLKLGTAISSIFVRTPPTVAMAAATLDDISGGRFILGLGSSHKVQVEPEHGVPYGKPILRTRETVDFVTRLIADGEAGIEGQTISIERFDLWFEPLRKKVPLYLAGLFPKMLEAAGEIADGIILTRSTLKTASTIRASIATGASKAGRDPADIAITSLLPTSISENRTAAFDAMRPGLAFYLGFFPRYNRLVSEHGFAREAAMVAEAWIAGDVEEAARRVTDEMLDATGIVGTPADARAKIAAYRASGIDLPILSPFARGPKAYETFHYVLDACAGA